MISTRTMVNEVAKYMHNDKWAAQHKNNANDGAKHKNDANVVAKHENIQKWGC